MLTEAQVLSSIQSLKDPEIGRGFGELEMLKGAELDFIDDLMGQSFRMKNPNAVASCGCGVSFTV